jgi:molybdopterin converting factor small subunit
MQVRVEFFASLREAAGRSHLNVEVADGARVSDLLEKLYQLNPSLRAQDKSILIGAGLEFVPRSYRLNPGEEIAVMPPVQGG